MLRWIIYLFVYLGSAVMVYNIYGFIRFARFIKRAQSWQHSSGILNIPIVLLILFLLGYLAVGIFGRPDLIVAGILFGGSIFVLIMYQLLSSITQRIQLKLKNEAFSLSGALEQVNVIAQTLSGEKGLDYRVSAPERLTGCYFGDETQLKQVLVRLLDNAVKFTDAPGTVELTVDCQSEEAGVRTLRFTVKDTGIGIDKDFLPHVFDVFSQEDASSTNRYGGSGLSLSATKGILELMGGTIAVESEKNVGSTFTVTLPLAVAPDETPVPEAPPETVSLSGKRVLVAEDIPMNAEIVMAFLEMEGMECEHAENGQIALEMFAASPAYHYDAILMDLRMPMMDGLDATRQIRALDRQDAKTVPIIALTANASESDVSQSMEAGMNMHMAKPANADALYATLRQFISPAPRRGSAD